MSTDNQPVKFEWTDELVKEYGREFGYAGEPNIEEFKINHTKQPKQVEERIKANITFIGDSKKEIMIFLSKEVEYRNFPASKIGEYIESVLNNDTEDKDSIKVRASYWKQVQDDLRFLEAELDANQDKIYTQSEVDTIRREEGLYWFREGYKYSRSFTSKIPYDEIAELTVVNAFNEISSLNSKEGGFIRVKGGEEFKVPMGNAKTEFYESTPSKLVNDEWEILSVLADDGKPIYYPSKDILDTTLKNNGGRIVSVQRKSDGKVFSVGDKIFDGWEGEHSHFSGTVTGFEIYLTGMLIKYGEGGKTMHIANAQKLKK